MRVLWKTGCAVAILGLGLLGGCAGSGSRAAGAATSSLHVYVEWTKPTRVVPAASNSILVTVSQGGTLLQSTLIVKPSTSAVLNETPLGQVTVTATAYPNTDGSGVAQASATELYNVVEGSGNVVSLTMDSTIDHLDAAPANLNLTALESQTVVVTPKDSINQTVLVASGNITFVSANPVVASVGSTSGLVTGLILGNTTVTASELDSGKTVDVPVQVGLGLSLSPTSTNSSILGTTQFTATVTGSVDTSVTWSVDGGASNGTISASGIYTAPATAGTYTIRATSNADPSVSSTATVVAKSGSGSVTIN